nr:unnamed protein product [Callosobruchus analis]
MYCHVQKIVQTLKWVCKSVIKLLEELTAA